MAAITALRLELYLKPRPQLTAYTTMTFDPAFDFPGQIQCQTTEDRITSQNYVSRCTKNV